MTWTDYVFVAVVCAALGALAMRAALDWDAPCAIRCRACSDDRWAP